MIRAYLQHQLDRAIRGAITNGLRNCHVHGMDSIVFHDEPGNRIRMFAAAYNHELYHHGYSKSLALAIHPHHCDITLSRIYGNPTNATYVVVENPHGAHHEYAYQSGIIHGTPAMTPTGLKYDAVCIGRTPIHEALHMPANALHTVQLEIGHSAAWMVIEGAPNPAYKPVCYTPNIKPLGTDLYQPMTQAQIIDTIRQVLDHV